jgi:hypothetical protein
MRQTATGDTYWTACLTKKYCYTVRSIVVTYLYVKRDKGHVTCTAYWNWLTWKTRWFVCILNLVTCSLSALYTPVYDIINMCNVCFKYICIRSTHTYMAIYFLPRNLEVDFLRTSTSIHGVTNQKSESCNAITCNSYYTVP